jgi:hypothetical protein
MTFEPFTSESERPVSPRVAPHTAVVGVRVLVPSGIITPERPT